MNNDLEITNPENLQEDNCYHKQRSSDDAETPVLSKRRLLSAAILTALLPGCGGGGETTTPEESSRDSNSDVISPPSDPIVGQPTHGMPGGPTPPPATTPPLTGNHRTFAIAGTNNVTVGVVMNNVTTMSDGRTVPVWNFGTGFNNDRAAPSSAIECIEGNPVAITLNSMMPHTIHPHGLDANQANDGVPSTSGFVGMTMGRMMANFGRVQGLPSSGTTFTYRFTAPHAGTYAYHCHVDTVLHMEMGMAGTIIVRPPDGNPNQAWAGGPIYDLEYVWQLHTFDSTWHNTMISGPNTVRYRPDYFLINGRDGSNLLTDPTVAIDGAVGTRVLIRLVNLGYLPANVSLGGLSFNVIASDGRPLNALLNTSSLLIGPGERYDVLFTLNTVGTVPATIDYLNSRGSQTLGNASTTVTVV